MSTYILVHEHWAEHTHLIDYIIENDMHADRPIFGRSIDDPSAIILSKPHWVNRPEYIQKLIEEKKALHVIVEYVLSQKHWAKNPQGRKWLIQIMDMNDSILNSFIASYVFSNKDWFGHVDLIERLIDFELEKMKTEEHRNNASISSYVASDVLKKKGWKAYPDLFKKLFNEGDFRTKLELRKVISEPHWNKHPDLVQLFLDEVDNSESLMRSTHEIVSSSTWAHRPDLLLQFILKLEDFKASEKNHLKIEAQRFTSIFDRMTFSLPHWKDHKVLKAYLRGQPLTVANLVAEHSANDFFKFLSSSEKTQEPISCKIILLN